MNRYLLFTLSAILFLSLFGKLAWEVHKESNRTAKNDFHATDPYFLPDVPPYTKQVYEITISPANQTDQTGLRLGTLIREIKEDDSPNTKLIVETYILQPPGAIGNAAKMELQCQTRLNSLIGLQNVEWDAFLHLQYTLVDFGLYYHLNAGPPSNLDLPVHSELKIRNNGFVDPTTWIPGGFKLTPRGTDAPSQIVKVDDFQLGGICFSPFTQRAGVSLYDHWPVKFMQPEDITQFNTKDLNGSSAVPYRQGQVVITNEVDALSPANGEPIKAFRAVCKLEHKIDDKPGAQEFRLEALYLADGTVLEVQTITSGQRLVARLQHTVVNWKKTQDPETGPTSAAQVFDKHKLYLAMFPEIEMNNPGEEDFEEVPGPAQEPAKLTTPGAPGGANASKPTPMPDKKPETENPHSTHTVPMPTTP